MLRERAHTAEEVGAEYQMKADRPGQSVYAKQKLGEYADQHRQLAATLSKAAESQESQAMAHKKAQ